MIQNNTRHNIQPFLDMVNVVDAHPYPLLGAKGYSYKGNKDAIKAPYFAKLGQLQQTLDVYIVDMDSLPRKKHTILNVKQHIAFIEKELKKIKRALAQNSEQWELRIKKSRLEEILAALKWMLEESHDSNGTISVDYSPLGLYRRNQNGKGEILIGYNPYDIYDMILTYIHEMMHAYYDASMLQQSDIEYAEEPLAELGKLRFCEDFDKDTKHPFFLYNLARKNVEDKQYIIGLGHYGFGLYLMDKYHNIPWENILRSHHHLLTHNKLYQELESWLGIFPFDDANARRLANILLTYILNPEASTLPASIAGVSSGGRTSYPWYRNEISLTNGHVERPDMIDLDVVRYLVEQIPDDYFNKYATFIDPFEKDSPFLEAIAERLMTELKKDFPNDADREKHIWKNMLFGCDIKDSATFLLDNMSPLEKNLKSNSYSVIIGVPPFYYQKGTSKICVYMPFIEKTSRISKGYPLMLFLTPTNWYMNHNRNCVEYRNKVIIPLTEALYDFYQTKDVFPNENFMGGVAAMMLREREIKYLYDYQYTAIPTFPSNICLPESRIWSRKDDLIRRGEYYHVFEFICHRDNLLKYNKYVDKISIQNGSYASWSIKNAKHYSKGYVIQSYVPGQPVPASNFVVKFDPKVFDSQAVEKFFQTKLVRYLVYNESPTTSWGIPKSAFNYIPVDLLFNQNFALQNGMPMSAINWTAPMDVINQAVYAYYNLPQDLIDYIEHTID